jgi:uncharacterized membrane protein
MNVQEKQAWYILALFALTFAAFAALTALSFAKTGGFHWAVTGAFGLFGLAGLTPLVGRKERREGKVVMDERDEEIGRKATLAGYGVFWMAFVVAGMLPFFIKGPDGQVTLPSEAFPIAIVTGMMIVFTVRSLVIVILYRRDARGPEA